MVKTTLNKNRSADRMRVMYHMGASRPHAQPACMGSGEVGRNSREMLWSSSAYRVVGLNSFCHWMGLTALCVLTGCLDFGHFAYDLKFRKAAWKKWIPVAVGQRQQEQHSCLGFGARCPLSVACCRLNCLPHPVTLFEFHKTFLKLERPSTSCSRRFACQKLVGSIGERLQCLQKIVHKTTEILEGAVLCRLTHPAPRPAKPP
ncbi:hypothetical protein KCU93_g277, partial [Aureobasidium melanogenum]